MEEIRVAEEEEKAKIENGNWEGEKRGRTNEESNAERTKESRRGKRFQHRGSRDQGRERRMSGAARLLPDNHGKRADAYKLGAEE
jgi:hypothetical protein